MIWMYRIIGLFSGALFTYWCYVDGHFNWILWFKFMAVSALGFMAAGIRLKAVETTKASRSTGTGQP